MIILAVNLVFCLEAIKWLIEQPFRNKVDTIFRKETYKLVRVMFYLVFGKFLTCFSFNLFCTDLHFDLWLVLILLCSLNKNRVCCWNYKAMPTFRTISWEDWCEHKLHEMNSIENLTNFSKFVTPTSVTRLTCSRINHTKNSFRTDSIYGKKVQESLLIITCIEWGCKEWNIPNNS